MTNHPRSLTDDERRALIESMACVAHHAARKYGHWSLGHDDLVQIGLVAVIEAVDAYDRSRGVPLRPYVTQRVRWALSDAIDHAVESHPVQGTIPHNATDPCNDEDEDYSDLWDAVDQLPRREQRVLNLYFGLDGSPPLKMHEAGERINRTAATVSLSTSRSLRTLRMALAHSA